MNPEDFLPYIPKLPLVLLLLCFAAWGLQISSARSKLKKMPDWMKKKIAEGSLSMPIPKFLTTSRLILALILLGGWAAMEKHFSPTWLGMEDPQAALTSGPAPTLLDGPKPEHSNTAATQKEQTPPQRTATAPASEPTPGKASPPAEDRPLETPAQPQHEKITPEPAPTPAPKSADGADDNEKDENADGDTFGDEEEIHGEEPPDGDAPYVPTGTDEAPPTQLVYPTPQESRLKSKYTRVKKVSTATRTAKSKGGLWNKVPEKEGAYAISITPNTLKVYAHDEVGMFYAKQTLSQLLKGVPGARYAQRDPFPQKSLKEVARLGELPMGEIIDWPDLPLRGTVEGFYGAPWSHEARKAQFDFYGRNKMNLYIYAPKDDKYHHGGNCYVPYPADKAKQLADLVKHAHKNHVRFVWAIHPANTINWSRDEGRYDLNRLCEKLEQMYSIGVRDFGVFVDDAAGEIGKAERQVTLCNYLLENFVRKHKDVNQELIMCPTGYNRAWANVKYLQDLGKGLDKSIHIMWTGDSVVHDITLSGQRWVNEQVQRPTLIWWNWPVNDYKRNRLIMGRVYGNGQEDEMKEAMSGFVSNPMEQSEASKVGLFSVADYCWNIKAFDSIPSWQEGIRRLYPESHEAVQAFCDHNSSLTPSYHGYQREESANVAETVKLLTESLKTGKPEMKALARMAKEFARIQAAAKVLMTGKDLKELREEAKPWFESFALLGEAGSKTMEALKGKKIADQIEPLISAGTTLGQIRTITRSNWSGGSVNQVPDVQVGGAALTPLINTAFDALSDRICAELAGKSLKALQPEFICQGGDATKAGDSLRDGDPKTSWSSGAHQKEGDWIGYDFSEPIEVHAINLQMGGGGGQDFFEQGQLEISQNGKDWTPTGNPVGGTSISLHFDEQPLKARMIRFRITKPRNNWLAVNEFTVNQAGSILPETNIGSLIGGLSVTQDKNSVGLGRVMEVHQCQPSGYIGLSLASPIAASRLEINLENNSINNWGEVSIELDDGKIVKPKCTLTDGTKLCCEGNSMPNKPIKSVRLTNTGNGAQSIKINTFKLETNGNDPTRSVNSLTDGSLRSAFSCNEAVNVRIRVPEGARYVAIISDAQCSISGAGKAIRKDGVRYFKVPGKAKTITLTAPKQPGKWISELIFRKTKP